MDMRLGDVPVQVLREAMADALKAVAGLEWTRENLVARLREGRGGLIGYEAADEIERLRDELAAANSRCIRLETELCK
jgi:hypothetical protein